MTEIGKYAAPAGMVKGAAGAGEENQNRPTRTIEIKRAWLLCNQFGYRSTLVWAAISTRRKLMSGPRSTNLPK